MLAISAHWYIHAAAVTAMPRPRTVHDFFGFPPEVFAFEYPAPGDPDLADEIVRVADPTWIGLDVDSWGLDHGAWSVLCHMFPDADVPVLQLSVDGSKPLSFHFELGAKLAPLRERGVLILGSGNICHGRGDRAMGDRPYEWAGRFDATVRSHLLDGTGKALVDIEHDPDFALAAPTPDHFLPVLYLAGLAAESGEQARVLVEGFGGGAGSMTALALDG